MTANSYTSLCKNWLSVEENSFTDKSVNEFPYSRDDQYLANTSEAFSKEIQNKQPLSSHHVSVPVGVHVEHFRLVHIH